MKYRGLCIDLEMDSKIFLACLHPFGTALVQVHYFLQIPMYHVLFLGPGGMPAVVIFPGEDGGWKEDGRGITGLSEQLGRLLEELEIA